MKDKVVLITGIAIAITTVNCASFNRPSSNTPSPQFADTLLEQTLQRQILLDGAGFGPGVVDGQDGEFTRKAGLLFQQARGLSAEALNDLERNIQTRSKYLITEKDLNSLGTMASGPAAQSQQERLPYTSLAELLAERFHTTRAFLQKLNPGSDLNSLSAGARITVPNVRRPFRYDQFPSTYSPAPEATSNSRRVIVDVQEKILQVFENQQVIAAFPITPGSSRHPAPEGEWRIVGSVPWPWYRHDDGVLNRGERTDEFYHLPPGPNSPVGILWAGLNRPGIGIHGTPNPDTIGRAGSHGCIRLSNWDAATFYTLVTKGTPVTIR